MLKKCKCNSHTCIIIHGMLSIFTQFTLRVTKKFTYVHLAEDTIYRTIGLKFNVRLPIHYLSKAMHRMPD